MRGRLQCYMWMGLGWMDGMVIIVYRSSKKSTFGANKTDNDDDTQWLVTFLEALGCLD